METRQERHKRLREAFDHAAGLSRVERAGFLRQLGEEDEELRREVEDLLERDACGVSSVRAGVAAHAGPALLAEDLAMPERIGPYQILGIVGTGGMGVVYRARQETPERVVALKMLRPAAFSGRLSKRFDLETRVLARLQHPGIAQIYEAGMADLGFGTQPWFAMELIDGVPLSDWGKGQGVRDKLDLVVQLCGAVHHAHLRGVVHRDLKPDNILVSAEGRPKVLDFGVARVTDSDLKLTTVQTDVKRLIGTLPYMSPEQAQGETERIDARSDVYALGVLTYELLAGMLPYDLHNKPVASAVRVISDDDPAPLSSVDRVFRGDLETIVAKALEKEPGRRYASAEGMAADLRHYLRDEPIQARRASTIYQLKKLARRHRGLVAGLVTAFVVLIVAVIGLTVLTIQANRATDLAEGRLALANGVIDYIPRILGSASDQDLGPTTTVVEALERASEALDGAFPDDPGTEAGVRLMLGKTYLEVPGMHELAEPELVRALALFEQDGADPENVLRTRYYLGKVLLNDRAHPNPPIEHYRQLEQDARRVLGPDHELRFMAAMNYSVAFFWASRYQEAYDALIPIEPAARRALGDSHRVYLRIRTGVVAFSGQVGDYERALAFARENLEVKEREQGLRHGDTLMDRWNIARLLRLLGRFEEAEQLCRETLPIARDLYGDNLARISGFESDLVQISGDRGRFLEGLELSTDLVERMIVTEEGPTAPVWLQHARMLLETGSPHGAEAALEQIGETGLSDSEAIQERYLRIRLRLARGDDLQVEEDLAELRADADEALLPGDPLRSRLGLQSR